jgi:hypothetical protein
MAGISKNGRRPLQLRFLKVSMCFSVCASNFIKIGQNFASFLSLSMIFQDGGGQLGKWPSEKHAFALSMCFLVNFYQNQAVVARFIAVH